MVVNLTTAAPRAAAARARRVAAISAETVTHYLCVRVPPSLVASAATSLPTLDDFVPVMLEAEDENYNLFKLINELNKEVRRVARPDCAALTACTN